MNTSGERAIAISLLNLKGSVFRPNWQMWLHPFHTTMRYRLAARGYRPIRVISGGSVRFGKALSINELPASSIQLFNWAAEPYWALLGAWLPPYLARKVREPLFPGIATFAAQDQIERGMRVLEDALRDPGLAAHPQTEPSL